MSIGIGIIGAGIMGADHARIFARHIAGAHLVAISDADNFPPLRFFSMSDGMCIAKKLMLPRPHQPTGCHAVLNSTVSRIHCG